MAEYNSKIYIMTLSRILVNRMIDSKSLRFQIGNKNTATNIIEKAIRNKHIKENKLEIKKGRVKKTETYYVITKTGVDYLLNNLQHEWKYKINTDDIKKFPIIKSGERNAKNILRELAYSSSIVMAEKCGAYIGKNTVFKFEDDKADKDDELIDEDIDFVEDSYASEIEEDVNAEYGKAKASMAQMIGKVISEEEWKEWGLYNPYQDEIVFHGSKELKENAKSVGIAHDAMDFARSRIRGVLDSKEKSVAVYVNTKFGLTWEQFNTKPEKGLVRMWRVSKATAPQEVLSRLGTCVAIIVENPMEFESMIKSKYSSRRSESIDESFADIYDHVYVVPNDTDGCEHLEWLMLTNTENETSKLCESAKASGKFISNDIKTKKQFALRDTAGNEVAVGIALDIRDMVSISRAATSEPDRKFFVICYDWQKKYFEKALPSNVGYYAIG